MEGRISLLRRAGIVSAGLLSLAALATAASSLLPRAIRLQGATSSVALDDHGLLPEFSLVDHTGQTLSRESLEESVWIANFVFSRCAGQCPLLGNRMRELHAFFGQTPGVRLVSFSVDPQYDTPEILSTYAEQYGAKAPQWIFATGGKNAILDLVQKGFRLGLSEEGSEAEPILHSLRLALVDAQGHVRGYYDGSDEEAMRRLREDAQMLLTRSAQGA